MADYDNNIENNTEDGGRLVQYSSGERLVALQVAEDAAVAVTLLMQKVPAAMRLYQDQAIRAAGSAALNLSEGNGRRGRERKRYFQVAYASAREAKTAVRIAVRVNAVDKQAGERALALLDRAAALTWGLWRGRS